MTAQFLIRLLALAGCLGGPRLAPAAEPASVPTLSSKPAPAPPPLPALHSPVGYFRQLLTNKPAERATLLADKTPEQRQVLLNSLREYDGLSRSEREVRLLALEMRLHLSALMRLAPTNRAARLALVPGPVLPLVSERLQRWDQYAPAEQKALLENERAVRTILSLETGQPGAEPRLTGYTTQQLGQIEKDIARWRELPAGQQQQIYGHFQTIFDLSEAKKGGTFNKFNAAEKQQMEKTLAAFRQLPKFQRDLCITNFTRFAEMSAEQRRQFLVNAEMWAQMKPEDRHLWRELVKTVPPLPPFPPGFGSPPAPPSPPSRPKISVAGTNLP